MDNGLIPAKLLYALTRKRKWGESHTAYENMLRQFKSEAFGKHGMKIVAEIAEELIKERFVLKKPTSYGLQVSLNPKKAQEIKKIIMDQLGFEL